MQSRRDFLASFALAATSGAAAAPERGEISLAAWSLVNSYYIGQRWKNLDLPRITREEFGLGALELVSHFFENPSHGYLTQMRHNGERYGVKFVRIMVDDEGSLAAPSKADRVQAVTCHRRWVDAAKFLGCIDIRASMWGGLRDWKNDHDLIQRGAEGFRALAEYARSVKMNLLIETHGGASSDPDSLVALVKAVDHPSFGVLIDLHNINREVNYEQGVRKLLPHAQGISVHPVWREPGGSPGFDLELALRLFMEAGFSGYWGIESAYGPQVRLQGPFAPALRKEQMLPSAEEREQIWQNELKGVRLTKSIIERIVFGKKESAWKSIEDVSCKLRLRPRER